MIDKNSQTSVYHKLTPVADAPLGEYENALLFALNEKDVRNIAVTGVYGSGKSSLIKSFEEKFKNDNRFNFLNVSLASFVLEQNPNFKVNEDSTDEPKKNETQDIEKSLLQQIIFKVKSDALEDSQFTRIKLKRLIRIWPIKISFLASHIWTAFFVVAMVISTKFVFKPDYFIFKDSWLFKQQYSWFYELIVLMGFTGIVQLIFNWVPKLGLSKFSAGGAEISFNERRGDSLLNKHLDELIYFFATTRFNIVVFEDLDRLPSREILIKLREINQLINNSEEINHCGKNKVVRFIFALGDDLFTDEFDRTKFFDFMLPVIPKVNYSNSRQNLEEIIKEAFPGITFRANFLDEITQFLGDMRLIFNVANEFIVYKKRLDSKSSESKDRLKLDDTKLLATIIYKNKYPGDFAKLNQRQGKVWDVLSTKDSLISLLKEDTVKEIAQTKKTISEIDSEKLSDINELRQVYLGYYFKKYPDFSHFQINGSNYLPNQFLEGDSVIDLLKTQSIIRYVTRNNYANSLDAFSNIEKEINPKSTYQQRKEILNKKSNSTNGTLSNKLASLEKELSAFEKLTFSQLVTMRPDIAFKGLSAQDGLIRYLLSDGLLEEDYLSFTTYFYPGELSASDQQYLTAQLSNTPLNFDYKLDNPNKVFEKIKVERFTNTSILNLDMLTHSSLNASGSTKFANLIEAIIYDDKGFNFLRAWLKLSSLKNYSKESVLNAITNSDVNYWSKQIEAAELTNEERGGLVIALLEHLHNPALSTISETGFIQHELNEKVEVFDSISVLGYHELEKLFKLLKVIFSNLDKCNDKQLLEVIEKSDAYELTVENLVKILSPSNTTEKDLIPTFTYVTTHGSDAVKEYVKNEIRSFADNVLQNLENAEESEESSISLLENDELDNDLKTSLIQKLNFKIKDIESVSDKALWPDLINSKRVEANWGNVIKYFKVAEQKIDNVLLEYLNDQVNVKSLIGTKLKNNVPDELALARKIVRCNDLVDEVYGQIISAISISFDNLSDLEVNPKKTQLLLDSRIYSLTVENHDFLKENLPSKSYVLIEQFINKYLEEPTKFDLTNSELINLVNISKISEGNKTNIVKTTPESVYDMALAKAYADFDLNQFQEKLFDIQLLKKILTFDLAEVVKIKLFNRYFEQFDHQDILEVLANMPDEIAKIRDNGKPKLQKTDENLKFAKFLETDQYISITPNKKSSNFINLNPKRKILK